MLQASHSWPSTLHAHPRAFTHPPRQMPLCVPVDGGTTVKQSVSGGTTQDVWFDACFLCKTTALNAEERLACLVGASIRPQRPPAGSRCGHHGLKCSSSRCPPPPGPYPLSPPPQKE
eukprot:109797-Chlamydomonas_euryale.AAC.1